MHTVLPFLLAMITAIVLLNMWANKLKIAYPILLVLGGEEKSLTIEDLGMNNNTKSLLLELLDVQRNYLVGSIKTPIFPKQLFDINYTFGIWKKKDCALHSFTPYNLLHE